MYRAAYVAPFLKQAKDVAWEYLKRFSRPLWGKAPNESELYVELVKGQRLTIRGADNQDALRGAYLDDVILDEYADMHPSVWGAVIRPMLADRRGRATFIGTPKGRNAFWDMYNRAQSDPDWFPFFLPADLTGILDQAELDAARRDMTPEQYAQEFECSFDAAILGAYYGKEMEAAQRDGRITIVAYDENVPVHTSWDLGYTDSTAIWFWQVVADQLHVIDFYENHGQQIPHYAGVLAGKGYRYGEHWFPPDVRAHVLGMDRTRIETLRDNNIKPRVLPDQKVVDGINAARVIFPRMWFDERCRDGLEALRQYRTAYDEKLKAFKDHPLHDWTSHAADAFRYMAEAYKELKPEPEVKKVQPLGIMDQTWHGLMLGQKPKTERV